MSDPDADMLRDWRVTAGSVASDDPPYGTPGGIGESLRGSCEDVQYSGTHGDATSTGSTGM